MGEEILFYKIRNAEVDDFLKKKKDEVSGI